MIGQRYRVVRWIGEGACAVVYEVVDTQDNDRRLAVKVMSAELLGKANLQARFVQEAEAAIHIDSPFVVSVHAVTVTGDGCPFIVMELLDGEDLGHLLDRVGHIEEHRAVELMIHALSGLAHAHARGVLHRDIKPANLFLVRSPSGDELLKIVDLGISKVITGARPSLGLTRTNAVLGSPVYMSPEQCRGASNMDHRSDVYSVGVVLYECLTGKLPHDGENLNDLMFKIALEDAPDPTSHKASLDRALAAIVMKSLSRDIDKRFQSASAFREALLEWGAEHGARVPPTPSSRRLSTAPPRRRRLEVAIEEDEVSATPRAAAPPAGRLVDELESESSARGRRTTKMLLAAAAVGVAIVAVVIVVGSRSEGRSSDAVVSPIVSAARPADPVTEPASSATQAAGAASVAPKSAVLAAASSRASPKGARKLRGQPHKKPSMSADAANDDPTGEDTADTDPSPPEN